MSAPEPPVNAEEPGVPRLPASDGHPHPPAYPPLGYAFQTPRQSGRAIAVMVLGIVSIAMVCGSGVGVIPAVVALALAPGAKREIETSGGAVMGEGMVKAGVICSWITVGLTLVVILLLLGPGLFGFRLW